MTKRISVRSGHVAGFLILAVQILLGLPSPIAAGNVNPTSAQGRVEHPLPYISTWNVGEIKGTSDPDYQLKLIDQGHKLLLSFLMPAIDGDPNDLRWMAYYDSAIRRAAHLKLPIALVGTQWEAKLSTDQEYFGLPAAENPNVITSDGKARRQVSPFGNVAPWKTIGQRWASSRIMKKLQTLYPDPPFVLFVSNNEHSKLDWSQAEDDTRFPRAIGRVATDESKRNATAAGWIERYRALQAGMKAGLENPIWRDRAVFIGYEAFGPSFFGRWPDWPKYAIQTPGRTSPWVLAWDGASVSYYLFNWLAITDFTVFSPQVEAMNWIFMLAEARAVNPAFWFEMSTWDGHEPGSPNDKYEALRKMGQRFTPERYGGLVQFGMWLLRPRGVREFRFLLEPIRETDPYLMPLIAAVDRVHSDPVLRDFWQNGSLVANPRRQHPYQVRIPPEYRDVPRWFMLDTSLDPAGPWNLDSKLSVYSLALSMGEAPQRRWLIFAHSPIAAKTGVNVTIPGYRKVDIDVAVGGSFYLVDEASASVRPVSRATAPRNP